MPDITWTLSLRESGNAVDTHVTVNGIRGDSLEAVPTNRDSTVLDFSHDIANTSTYRTRFEIARKLLEYAHQPVFGPEGDYEGTPWYRENIPPAAPVDSQVVQLSPSEDLRDLSFGGVWALVTGGREQDVTFNPKLELELFVLAADEDYTYRTDVESALGEAI